MGKDYSDVYTEVYEIINHVEEKERNKIPKNVIDFIKENKNDNYNFKIDENKTFENQTLKRETLVFMALISLNYWCENDEEKEQLIKEFSENDKKREQELREKYNPDNLFKKKNIENSTNQSMELIEYKENIFIKLWKKIKLIFRKEKF